MTKLLSIKPTQSKFNYNQMNQVQRLPTTAQQVNHYALLVSVIDIMSVD